MEKSSDSVKNLGVEKYIIEGDKVAKYMMFQGVEIFMVAKEYEQNINILKVMPYKALEEMI